jgi:hypothetical protein
VVLLVYVCCVQLPVPDPPDLCVILLRGFPSQEVIATERRRWENWEKDLERRRSDTPRRVVDAWQSQCRKYAQAWKTLDEARFCRSRWEFYRGQRGKHCPALADEWRRSSLAALERLRGLIGDDAFNARKMPFPKAPAEGDTPPPRTP